MEGHGRWEVSSDVTRVRIRRTKEGGELGRRDIACATELPINPGLHPTELRESLEKWRCISCLMYRRLSGDETIHINSKGPAGELFFPPNCSFWHHKE